MPTPWRKGPPPTKGWWNASIERDPEARRWWSGRRWSPPVYPYTPDETCERVKQMRAHSVDPKSVEWRGQTAAEVRRRG